MKVKAVGPYQINHDGSLHNASTGAFDAPDPLARKWLAAGWVDEVEEDNLVEAAPEVVPTDDEPVEVDLSDYHVGGGYYEIQGERVRGRDEARKLLEGED